MIASIYYILLDLIVGLGHEDSDSENLDEIVKPLLPVNSGALEPPVTAEPLVPVSKLVEVEKKFEDLSRRLKVNSVFMHLHPILITL